MPVFVELDIVDCFADYLEGQADYELHFLVEVVFYVVVDEQLVVLGRVYGPKVV